jgi:hypothetical protein
MKSPGSSRSTSHSTPRIVYGSPCTIRRPLILGSPSPSLYRYSVRSGFPSRRKTSWKRPIAVALSARPPRWPRAVRAREER